MASCSFVGVGHRAPSSESAVYSLSDFEELASELSKKVNLFELVWEKDPEAEFFGGTSRDFLYWLKRKLSVAKTPQDFDALASELRALQSIDVRDFIIGESDIDIVTNKSIIVSAEDYGIKSIDLISPERFDRTSQIGRDEIAQGFIPVEKIRLGKSGFKSEGTFGNGLEEVFTGKISIVFSSAEDFASTRFAKLKLNHPVLLALRYLRLTAMQYASLYGKTHPKKEVLFEMMGENRQAVKEVISSALEGRALNPYLNNEKFAEWINGTLKKGYRSYTNPTATKLLHEEFRVDLLSRTYDSIDPLKPYLFSQFRDEENIARALTENAVEPDRLYKPIDEFFPNSLMYHGTRGEEAFRGILFQGVMESSDGVGGRGLYSVAEKDIEFAIKWGGDKSRVVQFEILPNAKIVDISKNGYARSLYKRLGLNQDEFCEKFGIDILKYDYGLTDAFVVKNSNALGAANGTYRKIASFGKILDEAAKLRSLADIKAFVEMGKSNRLTKDEWKMAISSFDESINLDLSIKELISDQKFEAASKLVYGYEGDEQFTMAKKIMDESMKAYSSGVRPQVIENSFYTTKNIILTNFPEKKSLFLEYYEKPWGDFIKKAFAGDMDMQWEFNEHLQIKAIIQQRFALMERGPQYLENGEALVKEMLVLYKEIYGDLNISTTNHIYEYTAEQVRRYFHGENLTKVAKPIVEALEESLFVKMNNPFAERALFELVEFYNASMSIRGPDDRSFGFVQVMNKFYDNFQGDVTKNETSRAFLRLLYSDFKEDSFAISVYREKIQAGYIKSILANIDEKTASYHLSIIGSLAHMHNRYDGLENLATDMKKAGYSKELVAQARALSAGKSFKKTCKDFILNFMGR